MRRGGDCSHVTCVQWMGSEEGCTRLAWAGPGNVTVSARAGADGRRSRGGGEGGGALAGEARLCSCESKSPV
jgi:hypothetical protein